MSQPKISIITPVYNSERFIHKCVDSIMAQTFTDWELLCIDDGSQDTSGLILDGYAAKDKRIRVFHIENGGVAMARQIGIDNATGEYSIHADSDDWMEPTMMEDLYAKAKAEDADMVICDYLTSYSDGREIYYKQNVSVDPIETLKRILGGGGVFGALWNKFIRTELYRKYNAKFYAGVNYCEDVLICAQILRHPEVKVAYQPIAYYHYWMNNQSVTHKINRKTFEGLMAYEKKITSCLNSPHFQTYLKRNVKLGIFMEAFPADVLSKHEIDNYANQLYPFIMRDFGVRWKIGFFFLKKRYYKIAKIFLHY